MQRMSKQLGWCLLTLVALAPVRSLAQAGAVQLVSSNLTVLENAGDLTIPLVRTGGSTGSVDVSYGAIDGTASNGVDFLAMDGVLTFGDGETNQSITVTIVDDGATNGNRRFTVTLSDPTGGATLGSPTTITVTILDDETVPAAGILNFTSPLYVVTEDETIQAPFGPAKTFNPREAKGALLTVTRTSGSLGRVLVDYYTTNEVQGSTSTNLPMEGVDYLPVSGTLIFDDYQMSTNILVPVFSDSMQNDDKAIGVVLANPRPAPEEDPEIIMPRLGNVAEATVNILEINELLVDPNDTNMMVGYFSIERENYRVDEYDSQVTVEVILPGGGPASVGIEIFNGGRYGYRANAGSDYAEGVDFLHPNPIYTDGSAMITNLADYTPQDITLDFGQNDTRKKFTIDILDDPAVEFNEDILVRLHDPKDRGIIHGTATVTILYDEPPAGALDREWNPDNVAGTLPPFNQTPGANGVVHSVAVQPDGKTVLGGDFTAVNSVHRNRIARMNEDGSIDLDFNPGTGADGFVDSVALYPITSTNAGKILIGGGFRSVNGRQLPGIARLNPDGTVDLTFQPGGGVDGAIRSIALESDGRILIAGDFSSYNGTVRNGVARLNANGGLDNSFDPGTGPDGPIFSVALSGTSSLVIPRTAAGDDREDRFTVDTGSNAGVLTLQYDMLLVPDDLRVYYDGVRIYDSGLVAGQNIISIPFGPGASTDLTIVVNEGGGQFGTAWFYTAIIQTAGAEQKILVGGDFTTFNGQLRRGVARLNNDGSVDPLFVTGTGADGPVYSVALQPNGKALIGGAFHSFDVRDRNSIARLELDGSLDTSFNPGSGANDAVFAIDPQADGTIYIGGLFTSYDSVRRVGLARLKPNGTLDTRFLDTGYNQFAGLINPFSFEPPNFVSSIAPFGMTNITINSMDVVTNNMTNTVFMTNITVKQYVMIGGSFTNVGGNPSITTPLRNNYTVFTRADKRDRHNIARLIGGSTPGPGNVEFIATPYSIDEDSGVFSVKLERIDGRLGTAQFEVATTNNLASAGEDYGQTDMVQEWPEFAYVAPVSVGYVGFNYLQVPILDDKLVEGDETLDLGAFNPMGSINLNGEYIPLGAALGRANAPVTIVDNDFSHGTFQFSSTAYATNEDAGLAVITVVRTNGNTGPVTVDYYTAPGPDPAATEGTDYTRKRGTLFFGANETIRTFSVPIIDDPIVEFDENIALVLTNATGGASLPGGTPTSSDLAVLSIIDNDFAPGRLNFAADTFTNSESAGVATITVTRTGGSVGAVSVQYATTDGTAISPDDYAMTTGVLSWANGDSSPKTLTVPLVNDAAVEGDETVGLVLTNASITGALGARASAMLVIADDDFYGNLGFSQPEYAADENGTNVTITVSRSTGIAGSVSIQYATGAGTAVPGSDYEETSGTLDFAPGDTSKSFQVRLLDDTVQDGDKTVNLFLTNAVNAGIRSTNAVLTIVDNESFNIPAGTSDTIFNANAKANGEVRAISLQPDGKVLMAGEFTKVNDTVRNRIARLMENGQLDTAFISGVGANEAIRAMTLQEDGKILIGGAFTEINNTNRNGIARLNQDGSLDAFFNPGAGTDNPVNAIALKADGKILLGGEFSSVNGVSLPFLAQLNTNGMIDTTFNRFSGANGAVNAIALQDDGLILIGGDFTMVNGQARHHLARLLPDGSLDAFNTGAGPDGSVRAVLFQPDGKIVIGGSFTNVSGIARFYLARLNRDGTLDPSFLNGEQGGDNVVLALAQQIDGKLVVAGDFKHFNGVNRSRITRLNTDGSTDPTINFGSGPNSFVAALALQPDRKIILGGAFTTFDGVPRPYIARVNGGSVSGPGSLEFGAPLFTVSESGTNAIISVRRLGGTVDQVSVHYETADGSAKAGVDYTATSGVLTFPQGEVKQQFAVPVTDNQVLDGDRTVTLLLNGFGGGAVAGPQPVSTLLIKDDESLIQLSSDNYSINENAPGGTASISVLRSGATDSTVSVQFSTVPGTATPGSDYASTNGTLVFAPGQTTRILNIPIFEDSLIEGNETIGLILTNASAHASLGLSAAILTIVDNDFGPGTVGFQAFDETVTESAGALNLVLIRTNGTTGVISVRLRTVDGTAQGGQDFAAVDTPVAFADGESVKNFSIPILNDSVAEDPEEFTVELSDPTGGGMIDPGANVVRVTINDDDIPQVAVLSSAGAALTAESVSPPNNTIDAGETVTVLFALRNVGTLSTTNLIATLLETNGVTSPSSPQIYGRILSGGPSVSKAFTFTAFGTNGGSISPVLALKDGMQSLGSVTFSFPLGRTGVGFANTNRIVINDNSPATPYPSTIHVAGLAGTLTRLSVTLNGVSHPYADDIDIMLVSPAGRSVTLFSDAGGTNVLNNLTLTFDDAASASLPDAGAIASGSYKPSNYAPLADPFPAPAPVGATGDRLSVFNSASPNGDWMLYVVDDNGLDSGAIAGGWSLNVTTFGSLGAVTDLAVQTVDAPDPAMPGENITYTTSVTNYGPALATRVFVTNSLPAGATVVSTSASQGTCTVANGKVVCDVGDLELGSGAVMIVVITPSGTGTAVSTTTLRLDQMDPNPGNNVVNTTTVVGTPSNLVVSSPTILPGGQFQLTLTGNPGDIYIIDASSNLNDWQPISTNTLTGTSAEFTDTTASGFSQRFYRARRP